ncbi:MAG: radical SAM protein [Deltaproteobacteria bacterium]|nr:radical SAM protein [Deltaproteobacteria bacterium]PWB62757.1 MAG: radical SAM protein [Deltaproteobacteria bacterium]
MQDRHGRNIHYLRISVTDRCNLRCIYCMSEKGVRLLKHEDILSFEEIASFTRIAVANGIDKVRITGGEPLIRKNIPYLIRLLSGIRGIKDLSLTTNGILLEEFAMPLKDSGLQRVNISLDTTDPKKYAYITRGGDYYKVMKGIDAAEKAGLLPIKINCVVKKSSHEPDAVGVKVFCESRKLIVRFIHEMNLETGEYSVVEGGTGGNCRLCNKLRLSSDGELRPCLFSDLSFNIRRLGAESAIRMAVESKPEFGTRSLLTGFSMIGG